KNLSLLFLRASGLANRNALVFQRATRIGVAVDVADGDAVVARTDFRLQQLAGGDAALLVGGDDLAKPLGAEARNRGRQIAGAIATVAVLRAEGELARLGVDDLFFA